MMAMARKASSAKAIEKPGCETRICGLDTTFPAVVLWQFRIASLGAQLIMWATLGLAFGAWTERAATVQNRLQLKSAAL